MNHEPANQPGASQHKSSAGGLTPSVPCPRCGRSARIIGGSESFGALYLRCDDCRQTSVAPA